MEAHLPAPGWGVLTEDDLTPNFLDFINGLEELKEAREKTNYGLRHFRVKGCTLNEHFIKFYYDYVERQEFQAREDDVFVVSFPKTGTTWTQEIVYLINTNFDYEKAKSVMLVERFPFIEAKFSPKHLVQDAVSPRYIKSHLPLDLLPPSIMEKKCKIIYIARNPKDTIVSFYHFTQFLLYFDFKGTFEEFVDYFIKDYTVFAPYDTHALQFWDLRNEQNILFLKYEDLKRDMPKEIRKIAQFLGKPISDEQVEKLAKHCSFEEMKLNPSTNYSVFKTGNFMKVDRDFLRKGTVGDWRNHGNEKTNKLMEKYYEEKFRAKGLQFEFEG